MTTLTQNGKTYKVFSASEWAAEMLPHLTSGWKPVNMASGDYAGTELLAAWKAAGATSAVVVVK